MYSIISLCTVFSKRTPLHDAALKGCTDVCRFLAEVGASVSARDQGYPFSHYATKKIMISLTSLDSDLTALHLAARKGHVDVCTCLVQGRADVEAKDRVYDHVLILVETHVSYCFALA